MPIISPEHALKQKIAEIKTNLLESSKAQGGSSLVLDLKKSFLEQTTTLVSDKDAEQKIAQLIGTFEAALSALESQNIKTQDELNVFSKSLSAELKISDDELESVLYIILILARDMKAKANFRKVKDIAGFQEGLESKTSGVSRTM